MQILFLRGNTSQNDLYTGPLGSISIDTQLRKIRIHDGATAGGHTCANMSDVNAVINTINNLSIEDIEGLADALAAIETKADKSTTITAGNGLTGGGSLAGNRIITLGTPETVSGSSGNTVSAEGHSHAISISKHDVDLGNVDNTSDADKPLSNAAVAALNSKISSTMIGVANGVAPLDGDALISSAYLPSYVDDVLEFDDFDSLPAVGEGGKIYITVDNNRQYRWSGSMYVITTSGAVESVAGKTGVVFLNKNDVGLNNVDNTSDANKPVSTAQQTALNLKANLASPTFTGNPTAPTQAPSDNSTRLANTAFVTGKINGLNLGVQTITPNAPLTVDGTAANPIISINAATTSSAGSMSATDKSKLDGIQIGAQVNTVTSVAGRTGAVVLSKTDVGLSNVMNYGIATQAERRAGAIDTKYMTPLGTKDFVENGEYTIDLGTF